MTYRKSEAVDRGPFAGMLADQDFGKTLLEWRLTDEGVSYEELLKRYHAAKINSRHVVAGGSIELGVDLASIFRWGKSLGC